MWEDGGSGRGENSVIEKCLNGDARLISRMKAAGEIREGLVI